MDLEGDVMMEGAVSSAIRSSLEVNDGELALSSEDLAWVDSCLVPDPDVPEGSWDEVRDALLDVLSSQPVKSSDSAAPRSPSVAAEPLLPAVEESDGSVKKESEKEKADISELMSKVRFENALLPTYKEGVKENGIVGGEVDLGFVLDEKESEPSVDEIFKVWELESPLEDDDFVTQLNKALKSVESTAPNSTETPYETLPLSVDDMDGATWKDFKDESLDSLVAGVAEMSLSQFKG